MKFINKKPVKVALLIGPWTLPKLVHIVSRQKLTNKEIMSVFSGRKKKLALSKEKDDKFWHYLVYDKFLFSPEHNRNRYERKIHVLAGSRIEGAEIISKILSSELKIPECYIDKRTIKHRLTVLYASGDLSSRFFAGYLQFSQEIKDDFIKTN